MTILQKEIQERSQVINNMGHLMASGPVSITTENESLLQTGLVAMLEANEKDKAAQEEVFERWPWLRAAAERQEAATC